MLKTFRLFLILVTPAVLLFFSDCKKNGAGNGLLTFSTDTLTFDTVFVTQGSTTQSFTVHNTGRNPVTINTIQLVQSGTQFRINVDGVPGNQTNVQIPGRDSIYVFAEVTVNPTNSANTPFVLFANVNFTIGNAVQTVVLEAYGQNAYFHRAEQIASGVTETWTNDKPHIIIGTDTVPGVLVNCGATLNIQSGSKIFLASNASIYVVGTLNALANSWSDSIIFRGIRLESYYQGLPGQWGGIFFIRNPQCVPAGHFSHCIVDESSYGIEVGNGESNNLALYQGQSEIPVVTMDKTIVSNALNNAVFALNGSITATNCLFYACGGNLISLGLGGNYSFSNCTMYNVSSVTINHQQPSVVLSNFASNGTSAYPQPLTATFNNCIIYGSLNNELSFNNIDSPNLARFTTSFTNCLLQTPYDSMKIFTNAIFHNLFNTNPGFTNVGNNNFTPCDTCGNPISPVIDYSPIGLPRDLFDQMRPVSLTNNINKYDIGAIEAQH